MISSKIAGTPIQSEVDRLISEGVSNKGIARKFKISDMAVGRYKKRKIDVAVKIVADASTPSDMPKDLADRLAAEIDTSLSMRDQLEAKMRFFMRQADIYEQKNEINRAAYCMTATKTCGEILAKLPPERGLDSKRGEGMSPDLQSMVDEIIADSFKYAGIDTQTLLDEDNEDPYAKGYRIGYGEGFDEGFKKGQEAHDDV